LIKGLPDRVLFPPFNTVRLSPTVFDVTDLKAATAFYAGTLGGVDRGAGCTFAFVLVHLFPLQLDIAIDLVFGEHVTGQQKLVIGCQFFQSLAQGCANRRDAGHFFGRQIIEIFVGRLTGIDAVFDTVKTGHQQGSETQVRVGRRIGKARLDPFGLGAFGPGNAHTARAV
jgi:hypothetical protein